MTQDKAADFLGVDPRTLRKILNGESLSIPRLKKLGELLDFDLTEIEALVSGDPDKNSPKESLEFGGYPFHSVERYEGDYVMVRYALSDTNNLHCSLMKLSWSLERGALTYSEFDQFVSEDGRPRDYSQNGMVHISADIGLLHFLTCWRGAVRLITASKLRPNTNVMFGAVLTQADQRFGYIPAISPIVIEKIEDQDSRFQNLKSGPVQPSHPNYSNWVAALKLAEQEVIFRSNP